MSTFYATAYEAICLTSPIVATRKNLTFAAEWHQTLARLALDSLSDLELRQFLEGTGNSTALVVHTLSHLMDILVVGHLSVLHAQAKGREVADTAQLFTRVETLMAGIIANDEKDPVLFIYPDNDVLMAVPYDARRARELNLTLPKTNRRASFSLKHALDDPPPCAINNDQNLHDDAQPA